MVPSSGDSLGARLLRGAGTAFTVQAAGQGTQFLLHVVIARALGATEYGHFAFAASLLAVLTMFSQLALPKAALRFVSAYAASSQGASLRGFTAWATRRVVVASLVVAVALLAAAVATTSYVDPARTRVFAAAAAVVLPASLLALASARLRGLDRVGPGLAVTLLVQPLLFLGLLVAWPGVWSGPSDAGTAMGLRALATAAAAAVALALLRERGTGPGALAAGEASEWRRVARPLWAVGALQLVLQNADLLVLSAFAPSDAVGRYAAAVRVASLVGFGLTAISAWSAPTMARLRALQDPAGLQQLVLLSARAATGFAVLAALGLAVGGDRLLGLFGAGFEGAHGIVLVLVLGQLCNAVTGPVGYVLTMTEEPARAARVEGVSAAFLVVTSLALVPAFGAVGAALASATTVALRNGLMAWVAARRTGIRTLPF